MEDIRTNLVGVDDEDDDLQMLEMLSPVSTPSPSIKSTAGIATSVSRKRRTSNSENDACEMPKKGKPDLANIPKSEVRNYFEKLKELVDGVPKCKCTVCGRLYTCHSGGGTSDLWRHVPNCHKIPKFHYVGAMLDNQGKKWKFDSKIYRDALSKCIIMHDLPFSYAENEGVYLMNKSLNPDFKPVSRNTAKNDCWAVYLNEKTKLKSELATIPGRICLTSDVWTAVTMQGYMTLTAHYIDDNFKLNSKLLAFCELDCQHTGVELAGKAFDVLKDWGIESKIFSLTLDNAFSNDVMQKILKERLNLQNDLLCKGDFFHVRCCAHILNIIVHEGLKEVVQSLNKIRESVKYVKATEGKLRQFQKCVEVHLVDVGGSFLRLDVATNWNSTYMMLESAIKYRRAFTSLSFNDRNYKHCPTSEEWEKAERICAFLAPFYHITNLISGSSYPTSNLYFMQIASIKIKLNEYLTSEDEKLNDMASKMKVKFDKYWGEYSTILALGCVLDPKAKLNFLRFFYKKLYPNDHEEMVNKVRKALYKLFGEYGISSSSQANASTNSQSHEKAHSKTSETSSFMSSMLDEYHQEIRQTSSNDGKSQLDVYLEEGCTVGSDVNVLDYWKLNKHRFPQLAIMACDVLSIPITTVASESSFSIGGRILHKYRSCLLGKNVQALICIRNWLHGFKEVGPSDMLEMEEITLSKQDSNVLDKKMRTSDD